MRHVVTGAEFASLPDEWPAANRLPIRRCLFGPAIIRPRPEAPLCCLGAIRHVFAAVLVVYLRSTTPFDCHEGLVPALER
jgi:hypothetical protein